MKNKAIKLTKYYINLLKNFGIVVVILDFLEKFAKNINYKLYKFFHIKHHNYVKKYLKRNYSNIIEKYKNKKNITNNFINPNGTVWVFWWQGL